MKAVYVDGYKEAGVPGFLRERGFTFFDGRSLHPAELPAHSLLALREDMSGVL